MDEKFIQEFQHQWRRYFADSELPIAYYYTDYPSAADINASQITHRCLIGNLNRVRQGFPFVYATSTPGCSGGKRYTGYSQTVSPTFDYFLSCGIPGEVEGERYKRDPELVRHYQHQHLPFYAPAEHLVFKRWDKLTPNEEPLAVVFFASGDVLSGLFTLANYDFVETDGVITPMGAGCGSIVGYVMEQSRQATPRCVLGMFDVSARPQVHMNELTFSLPFGRFEQMVGYMDESFLTTKSWGKVKDRIASIQDLKQ